MRVIVTGSRLWRHRRVLHRVLDELEPAVTFLGHGGQRTKVTSVVDVPPTREEYIGADWFAGQWAIERSVPFLEVPADWRTYGRAAGPIRNQELLSAVAPQRVVAFKEDFDPQMRRGGTEHMVRIALEAGVPVTLIRGEAA